MRANYKLTQGEVVKAMQLNSQFSKTILVIFVAVALALLFLEWTIGFAGLIYYVLGGAIIGACTVLYLMVPWSAKKQYLNDPYYAHEISLNLSESGLELKSHDWEAPLKWSDLQQWKHGKGMYLLYIDSNVFYMVPERALPDSELFAAQITTHLGPKFA